MGEFIERHVADDRMAIVAGDFNIDGRRLNRTSTQYGEILAELGMLRFGAIASAPAPVDSINPFDTAFDWDVDRADIARDITRHNWESDEPDDGFGTSIGSGTAAREHRRVPEGIAT